MTGSFTNLPRWHQLATGVLRAILKREDARLILNSSDEEILDLLAATYRVRHHLATLSSFFFLMNAKVGLVQRIVGIAHNQKFRGGN